MAHEHLADLLDLDAEVLSEYHREVAEWVSANLTERARVIDVGAGTGTGTLALARQLPDAEVIALDVDEEMLKHIQDKARASGLADRIRTVQADLDQAWPDGLKTADLVWAANSLHHMGDPTRAVAQIYQMLRPGGLLAVTELESFPRFLTDPAGAALEERIHAAMARGRDEAGMHMHEDWPARFAEAGLAVESERRFVIAATGVYDTKTDATDTEAGIFRAAINGFGLQEPPRDPTYAALQFWARHRRDLVHKETLLRCQILEHVEAGLPGYARCFDDIFETQFGMLVPRHYASPAAVAAAGVEGLRGCTRSLNQAGSRRRSIK